MTMQLVSTVTVGAGGAAAIEFTSIPQTATDLVVVMSIRNGSSNTSIGGRAFNVKFNSSSTSFTARYLLGNGSAASSGTNFYFWQGGLDDSGFGNGQIYVPNYAGSTNKSFSIDSVSETNATGAEMNIGAYLWSNTAAITSLSIQPAITGNVGQYSTASLYGITKGSGGATVS